MKTKEWVLLLTGGAVVAGVVKLAWKAPRPMAVAPSIDFSRYAGKWYEIARMPNRFQKQCSGDVTATYTIRSDGKIVVQNQCRRADGRVDSILGTARPADPDGPNTKLKVSFFWPFSGNYWILEIDDKYRWALIGEPSRKYLWVLSREPHLDERTLNGLLDRASQEGYDTGLVRRTAQSDVVSAER